MQLTLNATLNISWVIIYCFIFEIDRSIFARTSCSVWISVCRSFKTKMKTTQEENQENKKQKFYLAGMAEPIWLTCLLYSWRFVCCRISDACDELNTLISTKSAHLWIIHGFVMQWLAYLVPRCTWFWNWHCCSCSICCCWLLIQKHVAWGNIFAQSLAGLLSLVLSSEVFNKILY